MVSKAAPVPVLDDDDQATRRFDLIHTSDCSTLEQVLVLAACARLSRSISIRTPEYGPVVAAPHRRLLGE
jgi:hypothetical protein